MGQHSEIYINDFGHNDLPYEEILEQDINNARHLEEESAKMYCAKCDINWKFLDSDQDDVRGEEYFFCPQCKTDQHLISRDEKEKYFKSMLIGKVINFDTGEEKENPAKPYPACGPVKIFDLNEYELRRTKERITEKQQKEDKALDEYTQLFEQGKIKEAEEMFFKILSNG